MRKQILGLTAACGLMLLGGFQVQAGKVPLAQVPDAVQKAIKEQSKGEAVQHINRETKDGKVVYEAEFKRKGFNRRVKFAEDGSVVIVDRGFADVAVSDLPQPVQKTIREQQAGRPIANWKKETRNGQTVYAVEFKERGRNSRIYVASDGSIATDKRQGRGAAPSASGSDSNLEQAKPHRIQIAK